MKIRIAFVITLLSFMFMTSDADGQCPGSSACDLGEVYCSASLFDGLNCTTPMAANNVFPYTNLCFGVGVPNNLMWWSFTGEGGPLSITFSFDIANCSIPFGIQAGIFEGDCTGNTVWDCDASCNISTFTLSGMTIPCESYYMWVDGCHGDVCDFLITVSGNAGAPSLPRPLPMPEASSSPCLGTTEFCFPGTSSECEPVITWAVDGIPTGNIDDDCIEVEFLDTEPHVICVVATIGNPFKPNGICDQEISCITVVPDSLPLRQGGLLNICAEDQPFVWHGVLIDTICINPPCTVRIQESATGCIVDSIRPINLLPIPDTGYAEVVACPDGDYTHWDGTVIAQNICDTLIRTRTINGCDSLYHLIVERPIVDVLWHIDLPTGEICPEITLLSGCDSSEINDLPYHLNWELYGNAVCHRVITGDTCLTLKYNQAIDLEVIFEDSISDCAAHISRIIYVFGDRPELPEIAGDEYLCMGDTAELTASGSFASFLWNKDSTMGAQLLVTEPGTYCVSGLRIEDSCWVENCWEVKKSDFVIRDTVIVADDGSGSGSIELVLEGDRPPFKFFWSTGDTTYRIDQLTAGSYTVLITDDVGCSSLFTFTVPISTSTREEAGQVPAIWPNPGNGFFHIQQCQNCTIEIWDYRGAKVRTIENLNSSVDLTTLTSGLYWFKLSSSDGQSSAAKVLIQ